MSDFALKNMALDPYDVPVPPLEEIGPNSSQEFPMNDESYFGDNVHNPLKRVHDQVEVLDESEETKRAKIELSKKVNNEQWDAMFDRLVAYKARHGDCLVPKRYTEDPKLGTWVETQRVQYKRLRREIDEANGGEIIQPNKRLNQERLAKLESIGFAWSAKNIKKPTKPVPIIAPKPRKEDNRALTSRSRLNDTQWEEMYQRLAQFKEKYGHCLVPRKYEEDPKLATWVETQRMLWNRDYRQDTGDSKSPAEAQQVANASDVPHNIPTMVEQIHQEENAISKSPEEWDEDFHKDQQVESYNTNSTEEMQNAAVEEAVVAATTEAINCQLDDFKIPSDQPRRLTKERKQKLDNLGFVWSLRSKRIDDHWDEMFQQLLNYKIKHGDCLVPSRYEENLKLGKWVETQRYEYTKLQRVSSDAEAPQDLESAKSKTTNHRLTEERISRLESIGFEWKVKHKMKRYYDKQWDQMFERLLKFKEENGHCMVPKRYPPDLKLGTWVHTQRIQYRKLMSGVKCSDLVSDAGTDDGSCKGGEDVFKEEEISFRLTDDRRRRLEAIDFVWSARESEKTTEQGRITRNSYDDQWDAMFTRLKEYKAKYGDCLVPKRFKEDQKLGTWVDTQRVQYKKLKKKLEEHGIDYNGPNDSPEETSDNGASGGMKPVIGRLTEERIRKLESLGFVWSLRDDWRKHFDELKKFKAEHGHCNVPARYSKNRRLGIWVSSQRQQYKMLISADVAPSEKRLTPLTQERIDLLNELGFTWTIRSRDSLGESWSQRLLDLKEYRTLHGNCLVPSRYPENPELGIWVGTQRTQYRLYMKAKEKGQKVPGTSAMNEDRIRQLEEIGFVWALRGEGKRADDPDYMEVDAIEQETMQVANELTSGDQDECNEGVDHHDEDDAYIHAPIEQAEI